MAAIDRRMFLTAGSVIAGAAALGAGPLAGAASAAPVAPVKLPPGAVLPAKGLYDTAAAAAWTDGFLTGSGEHGATAWGPPTGERVVLNHHRFVLPNGSRSTTTPVLAERVDGVRDKALAGDYAGASADFARGWGLQGTQAFHPCHEYLFASPGMTTVNDYVRITDYDTGEVTSTWTDSYGTWRRRLFASRADQVVVHELTPARGRTVDGTLSAVTALEGVPGTVAFATTATVMGGEGWMTVRGTYPAGKGAYGFEGVTRVVVTGGAVTASGADLVVARGTRVLLLSKPARYETATGWDARPVQQALAGLTPAYDALLGRHAALHRPMMATASLDLGVSAADRQLPMSALLDRQRANRSQLDLALVERMFDSGRYLAVSASGVLPSRLTGLWAGSWVASWSDDFTTDANINLQIAGANTLGLTAARDAYTELILGQLAAWETNARNLYGARGYFAPPRTDGESGQMFHFNTSFPAHCWTAGADWLLYPLLERYQVTGDTEFLRTRLGPALMKLALFYEDFLTRTDAAGRAVFVPSFSPEISPAGSGSGLTINAAMDVAAGRHALQAAIQAATELRVEQGPGQGIARWTALLAKLPDYVVNSDGALAEWGWPGLRDNYNHRHVSHLYPAWPLHEINPEERPDLIDPARRALALRGDQDGSGHGYLHRALAAARLKDGADVNKWLLKILGQDFVFVSGMTSHYPNRRTYNADPADTLPALLAEALVYSRPGVTELLPAVPPRLGTGTIRGVRGRNRVQVASMTWSLPGRKVAATLRSDVAQTTTLICRPGIASITTSAPLASSPIGPHARRITLPAGSDVQVSITLP